MRPRLVFLLFVIFSLSALSCASGKDSSPLSEQHRMELIRTFNSDLVFIRTQFPMGKVGLTIKDGKISPDGQKLNELLAIWGPSVKPGRPRHDYAL